MKHAVEVSGRLHGYMLIQLVDEMIDIDEVGDGVRLLSI